MTLNNLKSRFLLEKDDADAALFMQERVKDAVANMVCFFKRCLRFLCGIRASPTLLAEHHHPLVR